MTAKREIHLTNYAAQISGYTICGAEETYADGPARWGYSASICNGDTELCVEAPEKFSSAYEAFMHARQVTDDILADFELPIDWP